MTHSDADTSSIDPPLAVPVRALLDGDVPDGTYVHVRGILDAVTEQVNAEARAWANGVLRDGPDSIAFIMFPRAHSRTDHACFAAGRPVLVTARVSVTAERSVLIVNAVVRSEPADV